MRRGGELAFLGQAGRARALDDTPHLEGVWPATARSWSGKPNRSSASNRIARLALTMVRKIPSLSLSLSVVNRSA